MIKEGGNSSEDDSDMQMNLKIICITYSFLVNYILCTIGNSKELTRRLDGNKIWSLTRHIAHKTAFAKR